jgi:hypothetical protein
MPKAYGPVLVIFCVLSVTTADGLAAAAASSGLSAAKEAISREDYPTAVRLLRDFIPASVANPQLPEAQTLLVKASEQWSSNLARDSDIKQALNVLTDSAKALQGSPAEADLNDKANHLLNSEFAGALKQKDYGRLVQIAEVQAELFPDQPPLATPSQVQDYGVGALAADVRYLTPTESYSRLMALIGDQVPKATFDKYNLDCSGIVLRYLQTLIDMDWLQQAIVASQQTSFLGYIPDRLAKTIAKDCARSLEMWAEATLALGNVKLAGDAVEACEESRTPPLDPATLARLKGKLAEFGASKPPITLQIKAPLVGNGVWADSGTGYSIDGTVQIGNFYRNHGGTGSHGDIAVHGPLVLTGGRITVSAGGLDLQGSESQPVVLDHVRISCEYTASIKAAHVLFKDCIFAKAGSWYWDGGYSAKWQFSDCLLVDSNFAGLSRMDYGISMVHCGFVGCNFPSRYWGYRKKETVNDDGANLYRGKWSTIQDSDFYYCKIALSSLWMTSGCNFVSCTLGDAANFPSRTDMDVVLGGVTQESPFYREAVSKTNSTGRGHLIYRAAMQLFPRPQTNPLWALAPSYPPPPENPASP